MDDLIISDGSIREKCPGRTVENMTGGTQIFIITGKGGVGKTTVSAVHAVRSAGEGRKTLLVSADMAHNLGDIFGMSAGGHVQEAAPGLFLLELDPYLLMQEEYPRLNRSLAELFGSSGAALGKAGEGFMIPGFENLFSLMKIRDLCLGGEYDRIIVDCAPTGETLSLLKLPELLTWYVEKFSPVGRMITRILTPAAKLRYQISLPDNAAMDELGQFFSELVSLQEMLKDPEICRVRLVCIPERMVVEETKRSYMYLNLYHYPVDAVFVNRILPENTGSSFMDGWHSIQQGYLKELESVFAELSVTKIPWYSSEVRGMEAVEQICRGALSDPDLFEKEVRTDNEVYEPVEGGYCLRIRIPGALPEDVEVFKRETDVGIRIRNYVRSIPLPGVLRGARMASEKVEDGCLYIRFEVERGQD